jgi:hypothetical protein
MGRWLCVGPAAIIAALLSTGGPIAAANAGEVLSGDRIRSELIGNTVSGTMEGSEGGPSSYAEYYDPDGSIRGDGYSGHWSIEGDTICLAYEGSPRACWQVVMDGRQGEWLLEGTVEGTGSIVAGNPSKF